MGGEHLLVVVWLAASAVGLASLAVYARAPGPASVVAPAWPVHTALVRTGDRATLVMVVHPRCPCSVASIDELARLVTRLHGRLDVRVLFVRPEGEGEGWERGALWESAAAIPGVRVTADVGGIEATRFGAVTSGTTLLYDAGGALRYQGGITASRGHAGDSAGQDAIVALVEAGGGVGATGPVYGCALAGEPSDQDSRPRGATERPR